MDNLKPVTLLTGASAGIGAALAGVFAQRGHVLVLIARREPELNELADTIAAEGGARPHVLAIDLLAPGAVTRIADELNQRGLEPEIVINNAGFGLLGPAANLDRRQQLAMIDLNMRVLTDLSLRFIPSLERHCGGILNLGSVASFMPSPNMAVYHASKAYVLSFSEALHQELAPRGIRVTALCPGPVYTEFQSRAGIPKGYHPHKFSRTLGQVANEGYDGLKRGDRVVVPGSDNKMIVTIAQLLPRSAVLWLVRFFLRKHVPS
jgi:short-subunit dehydrogenase